MLLVEATTARAQEGRLYLRGDYTVYQLKRRPEALSFGPFLRIENRFRAEGLVYNKLSAGLRLRSPSWVTTQVYYAHRDLLEPRHTQKHMAVGDIIFAFRPGHFRLLDRSENEWHVTDAFYRYRNYLEVLWHPPISWLSLWAAEELRVDSDQGRMNQNDVRAGVQFTPTSAVTLRLFYDLESLRRKQPRWENTSYVGLAIGLRAGSARQATAPATRSPENPGTDRARHAESRPSMLAAGPRR